MCESSNSEIKICLVPGCNNTSRTTPNKLFISLPSKPPKKALWKKAMCIEKLPVKGLHLCCEDHFDVDKDIENYMYLKTMKEGKARIKPDVVPHIFPWQQKTNILPRATITSASTLKSEMETQVCILDFMESKGSQTEGLDMYEEDDTGEFTADSLKRFIKYMHNKSKIQEKVLVKLEPGTLE